MTALSLRQIYLEDKYIVMHSIGSGHFGDIRVAKNIETQQNVAVKLEINSHEAHKLENEYKFYLKLRESFVPEKESSTTLAVDSGRSDEIVHYGFPEVYSYGTYDNYNYLIMELLGYNLEALFNACNRKFSLKCVTMIGLQILSRLEVIHSYNIIYRDIKPENFVIGKEQNNRNRVIYMIDFGLATELSSKHGTMSTRKIVGTSRYMSVNAHKGMEQSRRDDLESCAYVLIYFLRGSLPWQNVNEAKLREKHNKIMMIKSNMKLSKLCKGLPNEILKFIDYIKLLKSEDIPNYQYLHDILYEILSARMETCDWKFDWLCKDSITKTSFETFNDETMQMESIIKTEEVFCSGYSSSCSCCINLKRKK